MTDVSFNGVALSTAVPQAVVTGLNRGLLGERRDTREYVPGRAGAWHFPEEPGDRTISIGLFLNCATAAERRDRVNALATWADSRRPAKLILSDEPDRYWEAVLADAGDVTELAEWATSDIEFRAGPYAYASAVSSESWTATDNVAHTFTLPDDVEALPSIEITAGSAMASFVLTVNGVSLTYGTPVASGGKVTISSIAFMVTTGADTDTELAGSFNPAAVSMTDVSGDFPTLSRGLNSITLDTPAGQSAAVVVRWRRRYRG